MAEKRDWNAAVIEEFRENGGRVGGPFQGADVLLLHHIGARTGSRRVSPLLYLPDGDGFAIFGSKGGASTNPDWYHNLLANPDVSVEVGTDHVDVTARLATGEEQERLYARQREAWPAFVDYEQNTDRTIPVFVLEPR